MLHTQYVFVYGDTCILVINFAPPKVISWLRHWPQWTDQPTNAKFIVDVWKVGVRIKLNEKGIATKEEIELCIKEVIEGERGQKMKMNSLRWKELAKEAMDEGGSSNKNIENFVAKLAHS